MLFLRSYLLLCMLLAGAENGFSQNTYKEFKDIRFTSKVDGSPQYYVELLPDGFDQKKSYDVAIGLHGHGSDRWQFAKNERPECSAFRAFAADHQMIAISPDYRAKTSWMGPAAEADLLQIITQLKKKHHVNRVFLIGGSMGATSALTFAALHPDLVDGVVAMNGHANHLEYNHFQEAIQGSFGGDKRSIPMEYKKRSAEYWPEKLTMPIAFTVGMTDTLVPPVSAIRLFNTLTQIGRKTLLDADDKRGHDTDFDAAYAAMQFMLDNAQTKTLKKNGR